MSLYDSNGDERIDAAELASCPPLALSLRSYDADGDGQLVLDEIVNRLQALFGSGSSLAEVSLSTTYEGRPLRGAKVSLRPVEFLADAITPAEGETDDNGVARPTIAADRLPDEFQGMRLIEHGLYHVEITHPQTQIPSRYNTATELGFEVDPLARGGTSAKFALKP